MKLKAKKKTHSKAVGKAIKIALKEASTGDRKALNTIRIQAAKNKKLRKKLQSITANMDDDGKKKKYARVDYNDLDRSHPFTK